MNETHYLAKDKHTGSWDVLNHSTYLEVKDEYNKPMEIASLENQVDALFYIAKQMNRGDRAEKFWRYNAADKVASGGRIAYALTLMSME